MKRKKRKGTYFKKNKKKPKKVKYDQTTNFYKMKPKEYKELLEKNIQKSYKKAEPARVREISKEAKAITEELLIEDRAATIGKHS